MSTTLPRHVAIIMDGNGRWAKLQRKPRAFGHMQGALKVRPLVRECGKLGIDYLTLYCFSSENWGRPKAEIAVLMRLLVKYLVSERKTLMENSVRFNTIGDVDSLPKPVRDVIQKTRQITAQNTGLTLTFALSYGGRAEILQATQALAQKVLDKKKHVEEITEKDLEAELFTSGMPDPDLIIRSSGEHRLSNFLIWQSAYSEFYITEKMWPDFDIKEFHVALDEFSRRGRRFGLTEDQLTAKAKKNAKSQEQGATK